HRALPSFPTRRSSDLGPTGRKLSETSHGRTSCVRCTSSGRWYRSANAPVYPWVALRGQATSRSLSSTNSALRRAGRCRDIRHCGQFNESESLTALIRGNARTEKTELDSLVAGHFHSICALGHRG